MSKPTKTWKEHLRPILRKAQPATQVLERVIRIAVHVQKPTVMGIAGLASAGVNALNDIVQDGPPMPGYSIDVFASPTHVAEAFKNAGATICAYPTMRDSDEVTIFARIHDISYAIEPCGSVNFCGDRPDEKFFEWMRQILDPVLPPAFEVRFASQGGGLAKIITPMKLTSISSQQGTHIANSTLPLLSGGRCILLEGRPGVGKTTMAQEIAKILSLGRTVILGPNVIGYPKDDKWHPANQSGVSVKSAGNVGQVGGLRESLRMLSPGVIIVDDIDKIQVSLSVIEAMRDAAKLVIFTANNGDYDDVLDATMLRAGRVDEVFHILPEHIDRREPFNSLSETEWEEVRQWPIAYLNEVEKRLRNRPGDIRLNDLRTRISRKVKSGDTLH